MARILQQFFLSRHWSSPIVWYTSTGQFLSRDSLRETRAWHFLFTCSEPTKIAKKKQKTKIEGSQQPAAGISLASSLTTVKYHK